MDDNGAPEDPFAYLSLLDALMEATVMECPHCELRTEVLGAGPGRHAVGFSHEPHCPDFVPD